MRSTHLVRVGLVSLVLPAVQPESSLVGTWGQPGGVHDLGFVFRPDGYSSMYMHGNEVSHGRYAVLESLDLRALT